MHRGLLIFALCLLASTAFAAPRYTIRNLGTLPGYEASRATCLNDRSEVAGYLTGRAQRTQERPLGARAFLWREGKLHLLPVLPPSHSAPHQTYDAVASGINNHEQIAGTLSFAFNGAWMGTHEQAALWQAGRIQAIPLLPGNSESVAIAINDAGQVAGTTYDNPPFHATPDHVFLYGGGTAQDLGPGCATGINAAGDICGYALLDKSNAPTSGGGDDLPFAQAKAVLCDAPNGQRIILGKGYALNVNQSGNIVGMQEGLLDDNSLITPSLRADAASALAKSVTRYEVSYHHDNRFFTKAGFRKSLAYAMAKTILWRTGQGRSRADMLPGHWVPQSINDKGQIVGSHWLRQAGKDYDLSTLLHTRSGWTTLRATAINYYGAIAGYGMYHHHIRAFLMTPQLSK